MNQLSFKKNFFDFNEIIFSYEKNRVMLQPDLTFVVSFFIFILAYLILSNFVVKPILNEVAGYFEEVKKNNEEAERFLKEAGKLEQEYQSIIDEARNKALMEYKRRVEEERKRASEIISQVDEYASKRLQEETEKLEEYEKKVLNEIPKIVDEISQKLLEKVLARKV